MRVSPDYKKITVFLAYHTPRFRPTGKCLPFSTKKDHSFCGLCTQDYGGELRKNAYFPIPLPPSQREGGIRDFWVVLGGFAAQNDPN
jgi:hypothetical protein